MQPGRLLLGTTYADGPGRAPADLPFWPAFRPRSKFTSVIGSRCASGETPMPERLVLCGGAKRAGGDSTLRLALSGRLQNITLKLGDISKKLIRSIPGLLIDLIEIATYVYGADQATSRGGKAQVRMGADGAAAFASSSR
jgi:hypothetical protein